MARYSLNRRDRKVAGVCSTLGDMVNVDPTILRIGFVAFALIVELQVALIAYVALGIYFHVQKRKAARTLGERRSDFDRMGDVGVRRASIHALRTELDATDRRMMAIDHHLSRPNDELAREIEALREKQA